MTALELYTKGAKVWIPHPDLVWIGATLAEDYKPQTTKTLRVITDDDGDHKTLEIKTEKDLPFLRNPSILIGENDLTSLSYLHEPAVLYNLQVRFCQHRDIYTYCGIVLVAINPYDDLPIYGTDTIQTYRGQTMGDLDPHIFAVAEEAYTKLEREQRDQSIIVSGESGAGKTVSAKYAMRYFAVVGGSATETQIERKVLASSPIMEAIGNAKTTRNDNSSRFGKFIELDFSRQFHISGASMRTYLLEKSRVVFQAPEERNYHVFYQMCAARNQLPDLHLEDQTYFNYLNQGNSPFIEGVDDLRAFEETTNALNLLGFSDKNQRDMLRILASVLHLGNISMKEATITSENEQDQEGCFIDKSDRHLGIMADLLEIDGEKLRQWLCTKRLVSMREVILKPMSLEQAAFAQDALAKHIYAELFDWIVQTINKVLKSEVQQHKFIGILDIYGFETFETNSFEQFCINYANEKLQQQFNLHVFKLEQEEYIREGIEWKMIDFYDNQPCIDLIETKLGILDLLDEECKMPRGTDGSWTEKLYNKCAKYSHFGKARFGVSSFTIDHFADKVEYTSNGFLEKNRDTVIEEQIAVLRSSRNPLVRKLFSDESSSSTSGSRLKVVAAKPSAAPQKTHKKSVGSQFRNSLNALMMTLNATTPHYIRCIKPNDNKAAFEYNPQRAVQQLRACGVLETIRISAAGFPSRWSYLDFFYRYRVLCRFKDIDKSNMAKTCEKILGQYLKGNDLFKFGKTKIFFRAGQVAYLEKLRADKLRKCCIIMQSTVRAFIARKKYLRLKHAVFHLQRYARGYLARKWANELRRNRAAITIQRYLRGWIKRTQYRRLKQVVLGLQSYCRGKLARLRFMQLKYNAKAIIIQKHVRGWLARRRYQKERKMVITCQAAVRRFLARRQYKKLKIEARSIEHVKKLNKGLENKIISLQQKIEGLNKIQADYKIAQNEINDLRNKLTSFKALEIEIKNLKSLLMEKNNTINKLEETVRAEHEEKIDLINEQEKYKSEMEEQHRLMAEETAKLRKELDNINEIVRSSQAGAEENLRVRLQEEKLLMLNEQDSDRVAYQKLLQEYHNLEQHCENLERHLREVNSSPAHRRNVSDLSGISVLEENVSGIEIGDDHGYGSVRSTLSNSSRTREKLENIDWKYEGAGDSQTTSATSNGDVTSDAASKIDVTLILKLQHKLSEVEREKTRLQKRLDEIDMSPRAEKAQNAARDAIRISELELANSKLRSQLFQLTNSIEEGNAKSKLQEQLKELREELDRKTEEIIHLKSVLANQNDSMKSIVNSKGRGSDYINEDGELALAYETQKTINKQLELELQDEKARYKSYEAEYKQEIQKLLEDNERQQQLLAANMAAAPRSQSEAFMQHEISRLTTENLDLHDRNDALNESVNKLKRQLKAMSKRLKEAGVHVEDVRAEGAVKQQVEKGRAQPVLRRKERDYEGMFAFPAGEEPNIMKELVVDLKPRTAVALLPGLPAYIVFMCIRHTDFINDEDKVRNLLSSFTVSVKKVIKKKHDDFETTSLWLSNTLRLLHCMKQYSGEPVFQAASTEEQKKQCLKNFDLSEYRQVLSDIAIWIFQMLMTSLEAKIQPLIVPAILEHEEITGISGNKPSGFRGRLSSLRSEVGSPEGSVKPTAALLQELTMHHKILTFYGVDTDVISQIFRQIYYFLCATSLNNLLLRKELCHWSKGLQIRHNLSHFEMWTREKQLDEPMIQATLQPIIQAAHLLQARKTEEDVASVCEMCSALTPMQICKILNLYTPVDEFEHRVPAAFIKKVQAKLQERTGSKEKESLLMDIQFKFPVRFSFNPSTICLEQIEIPEVINLPMLEKL